MADDWRDDSAGSDVLANGGDWDVAITRVGVGAGTVVARKAQPTIVAGVLVTQPASWNPVTLPPPTDDPARDPLDGGTW